MGSDNITGSDNIIGSDDIKGSGNIADCDNVVGSGNITNDDEDRKNNGAVDDLENDNKNGKLVFLDVDGTILYNNNTIFQSTAEAIERARATGHRIFLSTGRELKFVDKQILNLGLQNGIFSAGANVYCDDRQIYHHSFSEKQYRKLAEVLVKSNTVFSMETTEGNIVCSKFAKIFPGRIIELKKFGLKIYKALPDYLDNIDKVVFFSSDYSVKQMSGALGEDFQVIPMSYHPFVEGGEIMQVSINKQSGIEKILDYYHKQPEDAIGIGDSMNDIEMLRYCGTGVAMGNASDEVKSAADLVTDDITKDGLYNAFQKLNLLGV